MVAHAQFIEALAKLISAILWPLVALTLALIFRAEISAFARRIRKGKVLGSEFELTDELDELVKVTHEAQRDIYVPDLSGKPEAEQSQLDKAAASDVDKVIATASENPEFGLILLAQKIEVEMKRLLAVGGHLGGRQALSHRDMAEYLSRNAAVSENLRRSLDIFWDVRNKIVHGPAPISRDDLVRTIDIGLTVLAAIRSIPHEKNIVAHPGADVFSDIEGHHPLQGVKALILETTTPGGASKTHRVFPTTRTHYKRGMTVTWEWNMGNVSKAGYYRDPWTNEIRPGWTSSAEFIGRDIDSI